MRLTSCEWFAERGDAMDSRVPLWFGLEREPRRAKVHREDTCLVHDITSWNELPDPIPYARPSAPNERPDPVLVQRGQDARRAFNRNARLAKVRFHV